MTVVSLETNARMHCSMCGVTADVFCNCGAPYISPGARAVRAVKENPEMSNVAIAKEIGVDERTVRRARSTSASAEVEKRTGLDGRTRSIPKTKKTVKQGPQTEVVFEWLYEMWP